MKIDYDNIEENIGKTFILKSLDKADAHKLSDYHKEWIGKKVTIKNDVGDVDIEGDSNPHICLGFGFTVEPIKK